MTNQNPMKITAVGGPDPVSGLFTKMRWETDEPWTKFLTEGSVINLDGEDGPIGAMRVMRVVSPGVFETEMVPD